MQGSNATASINAHFKNGVGAFWGQYTLVYTAGDATEKGLIHFYGCSDNIEGTCKGIILRYIVKT